MTIRQILEILVTRQINRFQIYSLQGIVNSVDETARTCEVQVDTTKYSNVLLQAVNTFGTGFVLIPSSDSVVTITFTSKETAFVSQTTKLDKVLCDVDLVQFNGGSNGGMVIKGEVGKLINVVQAIFNVLTGTPVNEPGNGSPSALQAQLKSVIMALPMPTEISIEDTKITH